MKDINEMTKKDFEALPVIKDYVVYNVTDVVFLPSRRNHESGYRNFEAVLLRNREPIGKCSLYDFFEIRGEDCSFDCLKKSGLMRVCVYFKKMYVNTVSHIMDAEKVDVKNEH